MMFCCRRRFFFPVFSYDCYRNVLKMCACCDRCASVSICTCFDASANFLVPHSLSIPTFARGSQVVLLVAVPLPSLRGRPRSSWVSQTHDRQSVPLSCQTVVSRHTLSLPLTRRKSLFPASSLLLYLSFPLPCLILLRIFCLYTPIWVVFNDAPAGT